ncbi:MAG: nucleoside monophosphate kinase [Chlamydiota bacterium]
MSIATSTREVGFRNVYEKLNAHLTKANSCLNKLTLLNEKELDQVNLTSIAKEIQKVETLSKNILYKRLSSWFTDNTRLPYIIILGKPGGGKSSFSKMLSKQYGYVHLSIGDIHRGENEAGTQIGLKIRECVQRKDFFGSEMVKMTKQLLDKRFEEIFNKNQRFILDNFPTSSCYLPYINSVFNKNNLNNKTILIVPEVTNQEAIKRILGRIVCPKRNCSSIYNLNNKKFSPKNTQGLCDECGSILRKRIDEKATGPKGQSTIGETKFKIYRKHIQPVIDVISKKKGLEVFFIDSSDLWNLFSGKQVSKRRKSAYRYLQYTAYCLPILIALGGVFAYKSS